MILQRMTCQQKIAFVRTKLLVSKNSLVSSTVSISSPYYQCRHAASSTNSDNNGAHNDQISNKTGIQHLSCSCDPSGNDNATTTTMLTNVHNDSSNNERCIAKVHIKQNIRYANNHPRNVLDMYFPGTTTATTNHDDEGDDCSYRHLPTLLFVHGGMWIGGSKEQTSLISSSSSYYDIAKGLLTNLVSTSAASATTTTSSPSSSSDNLKGQYKDDNNNNMQLSNNNVGMTIASHHGRACIMNYRLAATASALPRSQEEQSSSSTATETNTDDSSILDNQREYEQQQHAVAANHGGGDHGCGDHGCHPHQQVMDVARAIVFLIQKIEEEDYQRSNRSNHKDSKGVESSIKPILFIGGYSAGAHLAAMALSDLQYIKRAMKEQGIQAKTANNDDNDMSSNDENDNINDTMVMSLLTKHIAGFIGISGVYNLRRMAMSPLSKITIGPAFIRPTTTSTTTITTTLSSKRTSEQEENGIHDRSNRNDDSEVDLTLEASPIHSLLRQSKTNKRPLLPDIPLLLINAESDFELAKDSIELLVALEQFQKRPEAGTAVSHSTTIATEHCIVPGRNHFTIMQNFGVGLVDENYNKKNMDASQNDNSKKESDSNALDKSSYSWTIQRFVNESVAAISSSVTSEEKNQVDETATKVLEFMNLVAAHSNDGARDLRRP